MLNKSTEGLWRVVSRGYAANNIDLDSVWLEVFCPETTGFVDGEINSEPKRLTTQGSDFDGNNYTVEIYTSNTIRAKWKQNGTNRVTPPNVRRGERVVVWQYGDVDMYYWEVTGEDDTLRKLETVTHAYSNTRDESKNELTKDNTYYTTISTHQKVMEVGTSKADGEPFAHLVQLNTKEGIFTYKDDIGNVIQVSSKDNQIFIENASGSKIIMSKDKIDITAPSKITMNSKNVEINADVQVNGKSNLNGNVSTVGRLTNNGVNVGSTHGHLGVKNGKGRTSVPV